MNRLLLIPCIASCLGFVFLASSGSVDNAGASNRPVVNGTSVANADAGAEVLMSVEQIQDDLLAKWKHYNGLKYAFSRVYRPEEHFQKPGILVDESLLAPEGSYVGIFSLESAPQTLKEAARDDVRINTETNPSDKVTYPFVVDRRSGETMIFASGKWSEFSKWAVAGE